MSESALPRALLERIALVSAPEEQGEPFRPSEYLQLVIVTIVLPMAVLLVGWSA